MKKIIIYTFIASVLLGVTSCGDDYLNTSPTKSVSNEGLMENASSAMVPLNGIYRSMYSGGWAVTGNKQQSAGICGYNLMADCMGDDMVWVADGSGWYSFDAKYSVKSRYTSSMWRSYDLWYAGYIWVANANYIIEAENTMAGSVADVSNVIGQAYAIRAYAYFMLSQQFARTYKGHENEKCIPLYTKATFAGTTGQPRATNEEVYTQILSDINRAIELLENATARTNKSHIDYAVANQLKARICMVMNDWQGASDASKAAIEHTSAELTKDVTGGMNNINQSDVMWGAAISADQAEGWGSFLSHLDVVSFIGSEDQMYGVSAPKKINKSLYDSMGENDVRRAWWLPEQTDVWGNNADNTYVQNKFRFSDLSNYMGDMLWMRIEECYLTRAEAECRLGHDTEAQNLLKKFMSYRDENFTTTKVGTGLGALTSDSNSSLLAEIIKHRRIELWGEGHRIYDIKRLKQGFIRTKEDGWGEAYLVSTNATVRTDNPETYGWVLTIPQAEFDGNINMDAVADQNPVGSGL